MKKSDYFNPHEREARDLASRPMRRGGPYFNPHEREARDLFLQLIQLYIGQF